jgi:hypothetical protein
MAKVVQEVEHPFVLEDATMYRKIVGSLIYMMIIRPDLNYTVGLES